MKLRSLVTLSALSLGVGLANAATTNFVYFTGSTAFRGAIFNTFTNTVNGVFDSAPVYIASKCSAVGPLNPQTASLMEFSGNIGGAPYVVKCEWSGSEAGISDATAAVGASKETFLDTALLASGTQVTTAALSATDSHTVDLAMADTDQSVSLTQTPILNGQQVGIIPFVFVKNAQTNGTTLTVAPTDWLNLTNVTDPELRVTLSGGTPIAAFTANPADTKFVYMAGRDNQSGTFVNTMLDTQFGLASDPSQIKIAATNGYASINPPQLLSGKGPSVEGQSSGGTLSTTATLCGSSTNLDPIATANNGVNTFGWYAISYLGVPDAAVCLGIQGPVVAPNGEAVQLTYNGSVETPNNVANGTYSFWGNEWCFESANNLSSGGATVFGKLTVNIPANCDNNFYIAQSFMQCAKTTSGSDPAHF